MPAAGWQDVLPWNSTQTSQLTRASPVARHDTLSRGDPRLLSAQRSQTQGRRPITWLSRYLGHSSLGVTSDVYGHFEAEERKREAVAMEGAFGDVSLGRRAEVS